MPVQTTTRKVRYLIGLMILYRRFIQRFAEIASPLTYLAAKAAPNRAVWTDEVQVALEGLKNQLRPIKY